MPPRSLSMVAVQVRDLDAQVAWYTDVLGCTVDVLEPGEFCALSLADGGASFALACDHPDQLENRSGSRWRPNLYVDDFDATMQRLREHGVEAVYGPEGEDEGYRLVVIADPEDNPIGLFTYGRNAAE